MAVDAPKSATIRAGLAKKATFEASAAELLAWMQHDKAFAGSLEAHELAARCATLLRTRYSRSALAFWKASLEVFKVLQISRPASAEQAAAWIADCNEVLSSDAAEETEPATGTAQPSPFFEGQLSSHDPLPAEPSQMQVLMQRLAEYSQAQQNAEGAQDDAQANMSSDDLALLREELETTLLLALSEEDAMPNADRPAPPASKAFVRMLPKERLTSERLHELGGSDIPCSICRQDLAVDTLVQIMPCKHVYHPPCLKPWLEAHNSCPICREELPTDDNAYERDRQAARDAKGAANAQSHQDFLYI